MKVLDVSNYSSAKATNFGMKVSPRAWLDIHNLKNVIGADGVSQFLGKFKSFDVSDMVTLNRISLKPSNSSDIAVGKVPLSLGFKTVGLPGQRAIERRYDTKLSLIHHFPMSMGPENFDGLKYSDFSDVVKKYARGAETDLVLDSILNLTQKGELYTKLLRLQMAMEKYNRGSDLKTFTQECIRINLTEDAKNAGKKGHFKSLISAVGSLFRR